MSSFQKKCDIPMVSVIIPTFNYGHFILTSINSVRRQHHSNIEIVVIDDGSIDDTADILSNEKDIVYIYQQNQGLSAARNHGLRVAKGKYIQFLDADDLLGPSSISRRVEFLESNPDLSFVFCRSAFFCNHTYPESLAFLHKEWCQPKPGLIDLNFYYFNIAPPHAFLIRRSVIDEASLFFDTSLRACEDYDFWFRLAHISGLPGMIRSCWVYYRQHPASMSRSFGNQYRHDAELCKRIFSFSTKEKKWLDNRSITDYLAAMFASSVVTSRRLLSAVDRSCFVDFFSKHVMLVCEELIESQRRQAPTTEAFFYLAQGRLSVYRILAKNCYIDRAFFERFCRIYSIKKSYFFMAIKSNLKSGQFCLFVRLLKLDIFYAVIVISCPILRLLKKKTN